MMFLYNNENMLIPVTKTCGHQEFSYVFTAGKNTYHIFVNVDVGDGNSFSAKARQDKDFITVDVISNSIEYAIEPIKIGTVDNGYTIQDVYMVLTREFSKLSDKIQSQSVTFYGM